MTRRGWTRTFLLSVIAGALIWFVSTRFLLSLAFFVVTVVFWLLSEWGWPRLADLHLRWPIERAVEQLSDDDLGAQVQALMDMPLHRWPVIRSQVAKLFPNFKLSATERSVLVMWATFPLEGGAELDYHVDELSPLKKWLLYATNETAYPPERLDGTIVMDDPEMVQHVVATHKMMVNQLRQVYVPSVRTTPRK